MKLCEGTAGRNVTANFNKPGEYMGQNFFSSRPPLSLTEKIIFLIPPLG